MGGAIGAVIAYYLALPPGASVGIIITICYGIFTYVIRRRSD